MKDCVLRKKREKKEKRKDEAYYVKKFKDVKKLNIQRKALIVEEEDNDAGNVEVWFTDYEDDEIRRTTHRALFMRI